PMADSIMLAAAREHGATVWTLDEDFSGLPDMRYFARKADPDKRGVNIVVVNPVGHAASLSLELRNISLYDALRYFCEAAGLSMRIDDNAVVISWP
ncbi:MAG: hypothetical protein ACKOHG_14275, partial [Planctomycetia bacterium]